jgi:hypothetical protein
MRLLSILIIWLMLSGTAGPLPPAAVTVSITSVDLRRHVAYLASDALGGRYALSPSAATAAKYLAEQLASYGFRSAARDGSYLQQVPLYHRRLDFSASQATLNAGGARQQFRYGDDFLSMQPSNLNFAGKLVFVGYGIHAPAAGHDDFAGLDLNGKIVIAAPGQPDSLGGVRLAPAPDRILDEARRRGASGVILPATQQEMLSWNQVRYQQYSQTITLPPQKSGPAIPHVYAGPRMIRALGGLLGKSEAYFAADGKPRVASNIEADIQVRVMVELRETPPVHNVAAILDGADPKLRSEFVIFSAHYDHLQTRDDGAAYNGADDDASGTATVLEIAQALSLGPRPRRSVLVIFHTAEELGLFGSEFNTDYEPLVPMDRIVTAFNMDMVGRSRDPQNTDPRDAKLSDKNSIFIIGSDKLSTELHRMSEQTNQDTVRLRFDYLYNDDNHPERLYYRSDHYNYAKHGIPVIFYFTGLHSDYHQVTDDIEKLDFGKMERIARLILATGWRVANADSRPLVDKKPK